MEFIDTHYHCFDEAFDSDYKAVIEEDLQGGISKIIMPAIDSTTHERVVSMGKEFKGICYPTIGVHPTSVNDCSGEYGAELALVEDYLENNLSHFVAIGEIGLDLYWSKEFFEQQKEAFIKQLLLSKKYDLPVIIHTRDAYEPMIEIIGDIKGLRGVFHGFSGTFNDYQSLKERGDFVFGIGGAVTFKNSKLPYIIPDIPLEDIVLETDAPYLAPVPYRGKRNQAKYIPLIAQSIAQIKGISINEVASVTTKTAKALFKI